MTEQERTLETPAASDRNLQCDAIDALEHSAHIDALPNLHDLGGYQTDDGQVVRSGLAWRSDQLMSLQDDALDACARLGIRTVYDLRTSAERDTWPDVTPANAPGGPRHACR